MTKSYLWLQQVFENRLVALVLATAVVVPLVATPADSSMRGVAAFGFEALGVLLLAVMLWRSHWNLTRESVSSFLRTGANLPILMFLGLVALSCAMSPHRAQSEQELLRTGVGVLLYFVVSYQFRRAHHLAKLIDTLLYLAIVSSLIGFAHYATSSEQVASGQFGDHQLFGSFLMLLLPILSVTAVTEMRSNRQLAAQIATVLTITCLLLTQARTAWVGSIVAAVVMVALSLSNQKQRTKIAGRKHEWVLPIMLVLASIGFFLTIANTGSIGKRAATMAPATVQTESALQYRVKMLNAALQMVVAHPLTGVGAGLFPYFEKQYSGLGNALSFNNHNPALSNSLGEQAHNLYAQTAAELGIPGLLLLVTIITTFFIAGVRKVQTIQRDFRRNLLIGSLGAVAAFTVDAFASPSWQFGHIMMFMWLIMGVGVSCMYSSPELATEVEPEKALPRMVKRPLTVGTCLAMAAILPTSMLSAQPSYLPPPPVEPTNSDNTGAYVAAGLGGAAVIGSIIAGEASHHSHGGGGTQANNRVLRSGDVIDIIVGGHKDMNQTITITQTGRINYIVANPADPQEGTPAAGLTTTELATTLQKSLVEYGKINMNDQVIVRLNKEHLERQARMHNNQNNEDDKVSQNEALLGEGANQPQTKTDNAEASKGL